MGVLFGLAMDYEMFLVSAMREHYVVSGVPREAVEEGFRASARVVTAAALIMTSVFIAFVPGGSSTIQQIAFGLAVGVSVRGRVPGADDVVGPAVLVLLTHRAWWLSTTLQRLPEVDVEATRCTARSPSRTTRRRTDRPRCWPRTSSSATARPRPRSRPWRGRSPTSRCRTPTTRAGPLRTAHAVQRRAVVDGLLVPEQREAVVRRTALLELDFPRPLEGSVEDRVHDRVRLEACLGPQAASADRTGAGPGPRASASWSPPPRAPRAGCVGRGRGGPRPGQRRRRVRSLGAEHQPEADRQAAERLAGGSGPARRHRARLRREPIPAEQLHQRRHDGPDPRTRQRREDAP